MLYNPLFGTWFREIPTTRQSFFGVDPEDTALGVQGPVWIVWG